MLKKLLYIFFFCISAFPGYGQVSTIVGNGWTPDTFELDHVTNSVHVPNHLVGVSLDSIHITDFASTSHLQSFHFQPVSIFDKKQKYYVITAIFSIKNIDNHDIEYVMYLGKKREGDLIDIFEYSGETDFRHVQSGLFLPQSKKNIKQGLGGKFRFQIDAGQTKHFIIQAKSISGFKPWIAPQVVSQDFFANDIADRNLIQGMLHGLLWIMVLYNIMIFLYTREVAYFDYSMFVVALSLNFLVENGLFIEFFIGDFPKADPYLFAVSVCISTIFYAQFSRHYLNIREEYPFWDKLFRFIIGAKIAILVLQFIWLKFTYQLPGFIQLANILSLIELFIWISFLFPVYRSANNYARLYAIGTSIFGVGAIISIVLLMGKIPVNFDPKYFMNVGTISEIVFFSLGLGMRVRTLEREKNEASEQLIKQLITNEQMQIAHNKDLERKVVERTLEIENQKDEIMAQRDELSSQRNKFFEQKQILTNNITYASKIQNALLPNLKQLYNYFTDHFILYKPRNIVSGDFYWIKKEDDRLLLAVGDCTGHGVSGAFMSILGITALNEITSESKNLYTNYLANQLREKIKLMLRQDDTSVRSIRDGMDIALLSYVPSISTVFFTGAAMPLWIIRDNQLIEIKAGRNPIGIYPKEKPFEEETVPVQKGDRIYLFSDGFADQQGDDENSSKLKMNRFRQILLETAKFSPEIQREKLVYFLEKWQGGRAQTDDITMLCLLV